MQRVAGAALAAVFLTAAGPVEEPKAPPEASCPDLARCCVEGEEFCVHPGAGRGLLAVSSVLVAAAGTGVYLSAGDSLRSGEPFLQMMGIGAVGAVGAGIGAIVGLLAPRGETTVLDRPGTPTLTFSLTPGGTSVLDESSPYGVSIAFDPSFVLDEAVSVRPHLAFSTSLGASEHVDPRPQNTEPIDGQDGTFPVVFSVWNMKVAAGAEVGVKLPYPALGRKRVFMGRLEFRYRPRWELRRRVTQPGEDDQQATEHNALYPATFGFRWHLSPRQRFTVWVGPRIDFIGFTDPGSTEVRRGPGNFGSFHAEAWYQLDIPFTPDHGRKTTVTGRINLGYIHSNLDGDGFDLGAVVGFFGPFEVSFDLRLRRAGAPAAAQITAGMIVGAGGGAFLKLGLVAPSILREGLTP